MVVSGHLRGIGVTLFRFAKAKSGITAMEYAMLAALISVVVIGSMIAVGSDLNSGFQTVVASLNGTAASEPNTSQGDPNGPYRNGPNESEDRGAGDQAAPPGEDAAPIALSNAPGAGMAGAESGRSSQDPPRAGTGMVARGGSALSGSLGAATGDGRSPSPAGPGAETGSRKSRGVAGIKGRAAGLGAGNPTSGYKPVTGAVLMQNMGRQSRAAAASNPNEFGQAITYSGPSEENQLRLIILLALFVLGGLLLWKLLNRYMAPQVSQEANEAA